MTEMMDLIQELWFTPRDLVSKGFDDALERLSVEIPMDIHAFPTGAECWTWIVPERWSCHEAYLETLEGERLIDVQDHPLHVVSYSMPFEGVVSREELFNHLHTHPSIEEAIPYVFMFYERDWGLSCSQQVKRSLQDERYRVVIRSEFEPGELKVGEHHLEGRTEQTVVLCAHLDHPAMANDDMTGVVVGIKVMEALAERGALHYSYRLLILPETIGSVAYLSRHEEQIPTMVGGIYLEMLGNDSPHALQQSFQPLSDFDRCMSAVFSRLDPQGYIAPYRTVIGNDERQFNAPGVRVPMVSLSRVEPEGSPNRPYYGYHSSLDTPEILSEGRLEESVGMVLDLVAAWERDGVVVNHFKGEVFCSRYGIWVDHQTNPEGHRRLFEIMERCDGTRRISEIAHELGISFQSVDAVVRQLEQHELVSVVREGS